MFYLKFRKMDLLTFKEENGIEKLAFAKCNSGSRHVVVDKETQQPLLIDDMKIFTVENFDKAQPAYVYAGTAKDGTEMLIISNKQPVSYDVDFEL
jgi:hypothetical protein